MNQPSLTDWGRAARARSVMGIKPQKDTHAAWLQDCRLDFTSPSFEPRLGGSSIPAMVRASVEAGIKVPMWRLGRSPQPENTRRIHGYATSTAPWGQSSWQQ